MHYRHLFSGTIAKLKLKMNNFCHYTDILHKMTFDLQLTLRKISFQVLPNLCLLLL